MLVNITTILQSLSLTNYGTFDHATANTSVWLSAAAYCETNTYLTRTFQGYSTGFNASFMVDVPAKDVQGFIGRMDSQEAIYVVYRGSTSIEDWIGNFHVRYTDYDRCKGCWVHDGFYDAEQTVIEDIIAHTRELKKHYPNYTVVVTGHSLGGAMATLTAIDLIAAGIRPVRMFNFGSPRIGNEEFATWASKYLPDRNRVTHYRDIVVHMPSHRRFMHISGEWYEDEDHEIHGCQGYEDPNCSYQFWRTSIPDHKEYLTLPMNCEAVSAAPPAVAATAVGAAAAEGV